MKCLVVLTALFGISTASFLGCNLSPVWGVKNAYRSGLQTYWCPPGLKFDPFGCCCDFPFDDLVEDLAGLLGGAGNGGNGGGGNGGNGGGGNGGNNGNGNGNNGLKKYETCYDC
uniref:Uncharacterized shell protein 10 n=1 Tax=Margaritifera margaritifera TaxID=102329 RepID=USP10_PINMG|nr:RecName: Full=Uncharacterized shell protein 10; AltName: Full=Nacre uncharacterized shell protein 17; Flags: Precursor [Pinctada margaritifera]CCE46182.1 nacre uncharacterized shell protein 17 [Pinctada margaritifera]